MSAPTLLARALVISLLLGCCSWLGACKKKAGRDGTRSPTPGKSALDIFPVLQDERWAWGSGTPTLLLRGHFDGDGKEDVLVVAEPLVSKGMVSQHFFLLRGPALSPAAVKAVKIRVDKGLAGFRWDVKIRTVTSAQAVDLNGDGKLDVVVGYRVGRIAIFYGDGGHSFRLGQVISSEGDGLLSGLRIAAADLNGDKKPDILALGTAPRLFVWEQRSSGDFVPRLLAYGGPKPTAARLQKALKRWPPPASPAAPDLSTALALPQWKRGLCVRAAPATSATRPAVALVGLDLRGHTRLWWLPALLGKGQIFFSRLLPAAWPRSSPIRDAALLLAPFRHAQPPHLFTASYQFAMINQRGFGWMQHFPPKQSPPAPAFPFGRRRHLILWENALSFGLTAGRFGAKKEPGVVLYSPYRILAYAHDKKLFRYSLSRDPIVRKSLSLRAAVGADLDGDGRDALVMLSVGALRKKDRIGIQLLLLRKPLY